MKQINILTYNLDSALPSEYLEKIAKSFELKIFNLLLLTVYLLNLSPKFELPVSDVITQQKKQIYVCDFCGEKGHKITSCFKLNPENRQLYQSKVRLIS